ncbi:hypothetical protein KC364_g88 [Hortaea werneckii]|nr:hypothetical protein KC364_g88 [Hortaea werneckii]
MLGRFVRHCSNNAITIVKFLNLHWNKSGVDGCCLWDQEFKVLSDTATALVEEHLPSGPLYTMSSSTETITCLLISSVVRFSCSSLPLGRRSSKLARTRERSFQGAEALVSQPWLLVTGNRSRSKDQTTGNIVTTIKQVCQSLHCKDAPFSGDLPTILTVTSRMYQARYS